MVKHLTAAKAMTRRDFATLLGRGSIGVVLMAAGCGGGGTNSLLAGSAPTEATRSRVLAMHGISLRGLMQSGFQSSNLAYARNSSFASADSAAPGADAGAQQEGASMPLLGAFLRNVAAIAPGSRAAHRKTRSRDEGDFGGENGSEGGGSSVGGDDSDGSVTGEEPTDPEIYQTGIGMEPMPSFYFDYYLGLWVQTEETASTSNYLLYEDEAKTKPAGHITTLNPTDWETYPQAYSSSYEFTSGYLAGSHGASNNVTKADYSGSSEYENVYADGWKDQGSSRWSAKGDSSWSSRTDGVNGEWSEESGSFLSDGSGGTRLSSSDGYKSDYRYNSDGSGHGRITGPDPGLPVSMFWDLYGNTTITYADGSVERIEGWDSGNGGVVGPILVDPPVAAIK